MSTLLERHQQRDYERYEAYRRFEEATDLSERLSLPIENRPELWVEDGKVMGRKLDGTPKRMVDWAWEAYMEAEMNPEFDGPNSIERTRRYIEWQEAKEVETLQDGEMLSVVSPIPDVVLTGETTLNGYRRDLARTMKRDYYREGDTVYSVTYSVEQSNKSALMAAGEAIGHRLPASLQSEDILKSRKRQFVTKEFFDTSPDRYRYAYDQHLYTLTGDVFYAGSRVATRQDALSYIYQHPDILGEHHEMLAKLTRPEDKEQLRKRTAAAIDARLHGVRVVSITDGGITERVNSGNYDGECPTGSSLNALNMAAGKNREWHQGQCRVCLKNGQVGECTVCIGCEIADNKGKDLNKIHREALKQNLAKSEKAEKLGFTFGAAQQKPTKQEIIRAQHGDYAELKQQVAFGGAKHTVVDRRSGQVIIEL